MIGFCSGGRFHGGAIEGVIGEADHLAVAAGVGEVIAVGVEGEALGVGVVAGPRPRARERIARAPGPVIAVEIEAGEIVARIGLGDLLAVQRVGEGGVGLLQRRPHRPPLLQHLAGGVKEGGRHDPSRLNLGRGEDLLGAHQVKLPATSERSK